MTDKTAATHEYFEFSKVTRLSRRQAIFLIIMVVVASAAGRYFDDSFAYVLVFVPYFAQALWCDYANLTFRNTPRLKILVFILSFLYLVIGSVIVADARHSTLIVDLLLKLAH